MQLHLKTDRVAQFEELINAQLMNNVMAVSLRLLDRLWPNRRSVCDNFLICCDLPMHALRCLVRSSL